VGAVHPSKNAIIEMTAKIAIISITCETETDIAAYKATNNPVCPHWEANKIPLREKRPMTSGATNPPANMAPTRKSGTIAAKVAECVSSYRWETTASV
jgi:hypothetical protein